MVTITLKIKEISYYEHAHEQEATPEELTAKVAQDIQQKIGKWAIMSAAHILLTPHGNLIINDQMQDDYADNGGEDDGADHGRHQTADSATTI